MSTSRDGVICVRCEVHHIIQSERRVGPAKLESWRDFPDRGRVQIVGTHVMRVSENFSRYLGTAALRIRKGNLCGLREQKKKKVPTMTDSGTVRTTHGFVLFRPWYAARALTAMAALGVPTCSSSSCEALQVYTQNRGKRGCLGIRSLRMIRRSTDSTRHHNIERHQLQK